MKVNIAGVQVDNLTKTEALEKIAEFVRSGRPHYGVTPYSEMVVFASKNEAYRTVLNNAGLSLADGAGIIWAAKYLNQESRKSAEFFQIFSTGTRLLFDRSYFDIIKEQISGSRFIWDIARLASENNFSLALAGGRHSVAEKTALNLVKKYPSLKINLAVSDRLFDAAMADEINRSNSDILLIGYSPPKQEKWLAENIDKLNVRFAMGLGGTFDYIAGIRKPAPEIFSRLGLEWLWRLITQPWRIKRMWNAIVVFVWTVYRFKIKNSR